MHPQEGAILGSCLAHGKALGVSAAVYAVKGSFSPQQRHDSMTAAANCNASDWSMSNYTGSLYLSLIPKSKTYFKTKSSV